MTGSRKFTRSEILSRIAKQIASGAAQNGRAYNALKNPKTGIKALDGLKTAADGMLPSHTVLELVDEISSHLGINFAQGIHIQRELRRAEKALQANGGSALSKEERANLLGITRDAYESGMNGKDVSQAVSDALNNHGRIGHLDDQSSDDHEADHQNLTDETKEAALQKKNIGRKNEQQLPQPPATDNGSLEGNPAPDRDTDQLAAKSKLVEDLSKVDDPVGDLLFKAPKDLTAEELRQVQYRAADEPDREKSNAFHDLAMGNFDHRYGTDPVQYDAVGRMIQPPERHPHPAEAKPATGKSGQPLDQAVKTVAKTLADEVGDEPPAETMRNLQAGLNMMAEKVMDAAAKKQPRHLAGSGKPKPPAPRPLFTALKVDGQPGPKTRSALKTTAAKLGEAKVREGAALGRFQRALQANPVPNEGQLRGKTERAFGTLFRPKPAVAAASKPAPKPQPKPSFGLVGQTPGKTKPTPPAASTTEGQSLQSTVNDLGRTAIGSAFKSIKEDGIIGPKTTSAFNEVLPKVGPSAFTSAFGSHMGFFDDPEDRS